MKIAKIIIVAIIVCVLLTSCNIAGSGQTDYFGFKTSVFTVLEETDTHDGFYGDGSYYLILDCSEETEQAAELIKDWTLLPLTENLELVMYGGEKDGLSYEYNLAEEAHWPTIRNGVYKFVDRHSEATNKSDDTNLMGRHSFNFSVAVYDLDTNTLYYFEFDT